MSRPSKQARYTGPETVDPSTLRQLGDDDESMQYLASYAAQMHERRGSNTLTKSIGDMCRLWHRGKLVNWTKNRIACWNEPRKREYIECLYKGQANAQFFVRTFLGTPLMQIGDGNNRINAIVDFMKNKFPIQVPHSGDEPRLESLFWCQLSENTQERLEAFDLCFAYCKDVSDDVFDTMIDRYNVGTPLKRGERIRINLSKNTPRCSFMSTLTNEMPFVENELLFEGRGTDLVCQIFYHACGPTNRRTAGDAEFEGQIQLNRYTPKKVEQVQLWLYAADPFDDADRKAVDVRNVLGKLSNILSDPDALFFGKTLEEVGRIGSGTRTWRAFRDGLFGAVMADIHDQVELTPQRFQYALHASMQMLVDSSLSDKFNYLQQQHYMEVAHVGNGSRAFTRSKSLIEQLKNGGGAGKGRRQFSPSDVIKYDCGDIEQDHHVAVKMPDGRVVYFQLCKRLDDYANKVREALHRAATNHRGLDADLRAKYSELVLQA